MKSEFGLLGVLLFAVGEVFISMDFSSLFTRPSWVEYQITPSIIGFFLGFLILGFGLWLIVQSGKPETRQTPS